MKTTLTWLSTQSGPHKTKITPTDSLFFQHITTGMIKRKKPKRYNLHSKVRETLPEARNRTEMQNHERGESTVLLGSGSTLRKRRQEPAFRRITYYWLGIRGRLKA